MLILLFAAGAADTLAAQESGRPRAGPATDEPFTTSHVEPSTQGFARTIPCQSLNDDSPYPLGYEMTLDLAIQAAHVGRAEPEKDDRKCFFRMAEALARHLVLENPNDPEPRYWYAAAMGLRAVEEGGHNQVRLAQRAHEQSRLVLTIAPDHAGAHHILGRLHAGAMRLSGFKRFIATQILGGKALSGASWETAESFLAAAARLQPEVPDHHYELGLLYLDMGRPDLALAAFEGVLACSRKDPADRAVQASAGEKADRLRRELAG
jgi:tetratricopeptide (TPR) repeat protein